eukprot:GHVT01034051.1.p2 GENE.GHVT01034051.1~~GHVT01034051.1.p2  ORF type:complete len:259 (+),score=36.71 GHVT01034051.1:162-938(+)
MEKLTYNMFAGVCVAALCFILVSSLRTFCAATMSEEAVIMEEAPVVTEAMQAGAKAGSTKAESSVPAAGLDKKMSRKGSAPPPKRGPNKWARKGSVGSKANAAPPAVASGSEKKVEEAPVSGASTVAKDAPDSTTTTDKAKDGTVTAEAPDKDEKERTEEEGTMWAQYSKYLSGIGNLWPAGGDIGQDVAVTSEIAENMKRYPITFFFGTLACHHQQSCNPQSCSRRNARFGSACNAEPEDTCLIYSRARSADKSICP